MLLVIFRALSHTAQFDCSRLRLPRVARLICTDAGGYSGRRPRRAQYRHRRFQWQPAQIGELGASYFALGLFLWRDNALTRPRLLLHFAVLMRADNARLRRRECYPPPGQPAPVESGFIASISDDFRAVTRCRHADAGLLLLRLNFWLSMRRRG